MLIAQITDLHLGFAGDGDDEPNLLRLRRVLDRLATLDVQPDVLLVTGDLTERGGHANYARAAEMLRALPYPAYPICGNHDDREALRTAFGLTGDGPIQYAIEDAGPVRIVMLDTYEPGRMGGNFCTARAEWLTATLDADRERPTLIALHHPPFDCGIDWWAADEREGWIRRIDAAVRGRGNVVAMIAGHVHRAITGECGGVPVRVCPSVAAGLALTFAAFDPDRPDGRPMILDTAPGLSLHWWSGRRLVSHVDFVDGAAVIVPYNAMMQATVRGMRAERAEDHQA